MPGHRFYSIFDQDTVEAVINDNDELHHLAKVLRLKVGDPVELVNGRGGLIQGYLKIISPKFTTVKIDKMSFTPYPEDLKITLACAIPKKAKFENILEKCTELGVDKIIPLITKRTLIDRSEGTLIKKTDRFERVIINASKQSKRLWFPQLEPLTHFEEAIKIRNTSGVRVLIPCLEGERGALLDSMNDFVNELFFFIGPEGDFTKDEIEQAISFGAVPVSLGPNVLKVDTAAMVVAAAKIWIIKKY